MIALLVVPVWASISFSRVVGREVEALFFYKPLATRGTACCRLQPLQAAIGSVEWPALAAVRVFVCHRLPEDALGASGLIGDLNLALWPLLPLIIKREAREWLSSARWWGRYIPRPATPQPPPA